MNNAEVLITEGVTGSGKTYTRVCDFVKNRLRFSKGKVITNLPLNVEAIDKYLKKKVRGSTPVSERVLVLDRKTILSWTPVEVFETEREVSGPWELDLEKYFPCHIALDESQHYVGINQSEEVITQWVRFLSEIRHEGMTIEFITQSADSLHPLIRSKAGKVLQVLDGRTMQDPFWGIEMNDWYQLLMGWQYWWAKRWSKPEDIDTKKFWNVLPFAVQTLVAAGKKKKKEGKPKHYVRNGDIFDLYNSFSAPLYSEQTGDPKRAPEMWQENTLFQLNAWFFNNHWTTLVFSKMSIMPVIVFTLMIFVSSGGLRTWLPLVNARLSKGLIGTSKADKDRKTVKPPDRQSVVTGSSELPTPQPVDRVVEAARRHDEAERQRLEDQRQLVVDENEQLKIQAAIQNEVVLISGQMAVLVSGERITVGTALTTGLYKGMKVEAVNEKLRMVKLSDGIVLRMPVVVANGMQDRTPELQTTSRNADAEPDREGRTPTPRTDASAVKRAVPPKTQPESLRNGARGSSALPRPTRTSDDRPVSGNRSNAGQP